MSLILDGTNGLSDVDGTAGTPAIRGSDANTGVFFGTDIVGVSTDGTERMRVDASGNVGIGTSSPAGKFNVSGSVANDLTTFSTADAATTVLNNANGVATGRASKILFRNSGFNLAGVAGVYTGFNGAGDLAGALAFGTQTNAAGGVVERARIDSSGHLVQAAGCRIFSIGTYNNTTGAAANMGVNAGDGVFYRSTSSLKYKREVRDYDKGLASVMQLRSVYYKGTSNRDGEAQYAGLIAEEVHAAGLTEFVQYAEDGTPDALAYGHMAALAFKAIQELKAINDAQAQTIESLTARVVALEGQA